MGLPAIKQESAQKMTKFCSRIHSSTT